MRQSVPKTRPVRPGPTAWGAEPRRVVGMYLRYIARTLERRRPPNPQDTRRKGDAQPQGRLPTHSASVDRKHRQPFAMPKSPKHGPAPDREPQLARGLVAWAGAGAEVKLKASD